MSTDVESGSDQDFDTALASLRSQRYRPELIIDEAPAPQRLAPHAVALTAEILSPEDADADPIGTGRLVILHDPDGVDSWEGTFRIVSFVRATLESDLASDPLLPSVGWSWLIDSLAAEDAQVRALGGTVTRITSEGFGTLGQPQDPVTGQVEVRASWTPGEHAGEIGAHARAWAGLIAMAAGLVPTAAGVSRLARPATLSTPR